MGRKDAERQLLAQNNPRGTFLIRESETTKGKILILSIILNLIHQYVHSNVWEQQDFGFFLKKFIMLVKGAFIGFKIYQKQ